MNEQQKVAYVMAQAVAATAEIEAMKAANQSRADQGYSQAYGEEAFLEVQNKYCIGHNAVLGLFQS